MPRPKKTETEIQTMRAQILDTALAILQESGPEALTSRAIAERMGVAHMSLYTYFENQAAILAALHWREMDKWQALQERFSQRAQDGEGVVQVVEDLLHFFIDFARQNPNLYRMAWVMPETGGISPETQRQFSRFTVERLANLLALGMEQGKFARRDPFLAASTAAALVNTPYILFHSGKLIDPAFRDRMVEEAIKAVLGYLKAESLSRILDDSVRSN